MAKPVSRAETRRILEASRPHIDDVCMVFHQFHEGTRQAVRVYRIGSAEQIAAFNEVRADLKARLIAIGLADRIDWTEKT